MIDDDKQQPTPDEQRGMDWWSGLTEVSRRYWIERAAVRYGLSTSVADAWEHYKHTDPSDRLG